MKGSAVMTSEIKTVDDIGYETKITYSDYWAEVKQIAEAVNNREGYSDDVETSDILFQCVDSHNWVIYSYKAMFIMLHTDNANAFLDMGVGVPDGSWWDIVTQFAHCAFSADVEQAISRIETEVK
tara:strand:+ start:138 stop:512 length:375 start_codon:yes stop_codon:yes gene_type:complete